MNVVSQAKFRKFDEDHPEVNAEETLSAWYKAAKHAEWSKYADLKADYRNADVVGKYTVINLGGHKIRLILEIFYESRLVLIRHVLTHKEYDTNRWREDAFEPKPGCPKSAKNKTSRPPPGKEN